MAGQIPFRVVGPAAIWLAAVVWTAAAASGQQPGVPNPHAGEWSLEFRVATRPGGETRIASSMGDDVQTVNLLAHLRRPSFTVAADGVVRWEQREGGQILWDDFSTAAGKSNLSDCQALLRAEGQAIATPAPEGSGRAYDRRLTLNLAWAGSSGRGQDHRGVPFAVTLSADGSKWITNYGTAAVAYEHSTWDLEQSSFQKDEISPDVIRETTVFRASRQKTTETYKFGLPHAGFPVTERIEVKHVRYPQLVPRG